MNRMDRADTVTVGPRFLETYGMLPPEMRITHGFLTVCVGFLWLFT